MPHFSFQRGMLFLFCARSLYRLSFTEFFCIVPHFVHEDSQAEQLDAAEKIDAAHQKSIALHGNADRQLLNDKKKGGQQRADAQQAACDRGEAQRCNGKRSNAVKRVFDQPPKGPAGPAACALYVRVFQISGLIARPNKKALGKGPALSKSLVPPSASILQRTG